MLGVWKHPSHEVLVGNTATFADGSRFEVPVYARRGAVGAVQTRAQSAKGTKETVLPVTKSCGLSVTADVLKQAQRVDPTLDRARAMAETKETAPSGKGTVRCEVKNGILRRIFKSTGTECQQLCVPKELSAEVLRLTHDTPTGGHMGAKRTQERIWTDFYWPGMCGDFRRYCTSCDQCQKMSPRGRVPKVPLVAMPLVDEPFRRVAVDLIGPIIPASDRGNRYVLVMADCATRYPEAIPLRNTETETAAEALWEIWSRLGVPDQMITDKGTQFTSNMMQELNRLFGVRGGTTILYHPQTNGLLEWFNGTLKSLLKKVCQEKPRTWYRFIPAILFAYREVPQESAGFSPFKVLYGRTVRGPMRILRELWTGDQENEEVRTASQYVLDLRNRVEETCTIARKSLRHASAEQKAISNHSNPLIIT